MQSVRRRDTAPELRLRRILYGRGLRYRVDVAPLVVQGARADIVFTRARVAVFVDGCFWHGCTQHRPLPRTNSDYWRRKIARNQQRDAETDSLLRDNGWIVIRVWEHDDPQEGAERVVAAVSSARASKSQDI